MHHILLTVIGGIAEELCTCACTFLLSSEEVRQDYMRNLIVTHGQFCHCKYVQNICCYYGRLTMR